MKKEDEELVDRIISQYPEPVEDNDRYWVWKHSPLENCAKILAPQGVTSIEWDLRYGGVIVNFVMRPPHYMSTSDMSRILDQYVSSGVVLDVLDFATQRR